MVIPLEHVKPGDTVKVVWIASEEGMARRLNDLGFVPGNDIECVLKGRKGGMQAYLVRNAVIALRQSTAKEVLVELAAEVCGCSDSCDC